MAVAARGRQQAQVKEQGRGRNGPRLPLFSPGRRAGTRNRRASLCGRSGGQSRPRKAGQY
jgi:hypothetical protein